MAKQITKTESLKIAQQFYLENVLKGNNNLKSASALDFKLDFISTDSEPTLKSGTAINETSAYYYVYNVGNDQGFVIVSGDDRTTPVLGYSNEGKFVYENMPEHVKEFMDNYRKQVQLLMQSSDSIVFKSKETSQSTSVVVPLIKTKWGQSSPYNSKVPKQYLTGCIATSMAQVMNYHKWPKQAFGSKTTYDWDNMLNAYSFSDDTSSVSCKAVATLMYHCGVAVNMKYSYSSSETYADNIPGALLGHFGYDRDVVNISHGNLSDSYWKNLIMSELDANRPVILGGFSSEGGHSYVGDGYDENRLIHINWGWDGYNDGYFEISSLSTTPKNISFYSGQNMVIGIKKPVNNSKFSLFYSDFSIVKGYGISISRNTPVEEYFNSIECSGNRFVGKVGIALYQNNTLRLVFDSAQVIINESRQDRNQWVRSKFNMKFNDLISSGTYQLKPVYKSENDSVWIPSENYDSSNIEVEITDTQLVFFANSKTVICKAPGEIAANISNKDRYNLNRLVVSGTIGNQDIQFMRDNLNNINTIDLKNVEIVKTTDVDEVYKAQEIGREAFAYSKIQYLELPSKLRSIGKQAFYYSRLTKISIPSAITIINEGLFANCNYLISVTLPDTLKSIRRSAFDRCTSLQSIELPAKVDSIYENAFIYCTGLTQILSYNITPPIIVGTPFKYVPVTIPVHVPIGCKTIYKSANGWRNFTNIIADLPAKVKKTVYNPIAGKLSTHFTKGEKTTINNLTIAGNLNASDFIFMRDSLQAVTFIDIKEVKLPENRIPSKAFYKNQPTACPLKEFVLPKSLIAIGDSAFKNCSYLVDISFPNYLSKIGTGAFDGCSKITQFKLDDGPSVYRVEDGVVFNSDHTSLILYPCGKSEKTFGSWWSVTSIGNSAFGACQNLEVVTFPDNLTSIGDYAFNGCKSLKVLSLPAKINNIGEGAFNNCTNITIITSDNNTPPKIGGSLTFGGISKDIKVKVPSGMVLKYNEAFGWKEFSNINDDAITKIVLNNIVGKLSTRFTEDEKISVTKLIITGDLNSDDLYFAKNSITKLTILDISGTSLKIIDNGTFYNWRNLNSIMLPSSVTSIGSSAFYGCSGLTTLNISSSVTSIGTQAFQGCTGLTSINIPSAITSIGSSTFYGCSGLTSLTIPSSVTLIGTQAFQGCSSLTTINIPSSVTSIEPYSFSGCKSLSKIELPSFVKSIGDYAFSDCSGLTSLTIPSSVTSIGTGAFSGCNGLTSMTIPSTITSIKAGTFKYCNGLTSLIISPAVTKIEKNAFIGCNRLTSFTIPPAVTKIEESIFSGCSGLTSINIPSSVDSIGKYAFSGCSGLTSIIIPSSVTSISESAFRSCSGLTSVTIPSSISTIEKSVFNGCRSLTSLTIQSSITSIGEEAFSWSGLTSITFPLSVTSIGTNAFSYSKLKSIKVINPVPIDLSASTGVFNNLDNACILNVPVGSKSAYQNAAQWKNFKYIIEGDYSTTKAINISAGLLSNALSSNELVAVTNLSVTGTIDSRDFVFLRDSMLNLSILDLSGVEIESYTGTEGTAGKNLTTYKSKAIPQYAFYNSISYKGKVTLTSVILPSSISSIGNLAFYSCSGLTGTLSISSSINSIEYYVFCGTGLNVSVDGDNPNYSSIDGVLFNKLQTEIIYCPAFKAGGYTIPSTVTSISSSAFSSCKYLTSISIPSSVKSIGTGAFDGCVSLTSITIPPSINTIERYTFYGCSGLTSIFIPSSITSLGENAFAYCRNLTSINAYSQIPVDLSNSLNVFVNVNKSTCILHVPIGSRNAYQTANQWKDFVNIVDDLVPLTISLDTNSILAPKEGSTAIVEITSNTQWVASSNQTWLTVSPGTETTGNGTITFVAFANLTSSPRAALVTVSGAGITSQTITVTQEAGTGTWVSDLKNEKVKIYPNPVTDGFYVDGIEGTAKLVLSDLNGRIQISKEIIGHENISIGSLPNGVYFVTVKSKKVNVVRKLVKK